MRFSDPLPLFRPTPGRNTPFNGRYKITLTTVYYRSPGQETHLLHRRYCACEMHGSARIKLHLYVIRFNYFGISRGFGAMLGIRGLTTCSLNSVFGSWRVSVTIIYIIIVFDGQFQSICLRFERNHETLCYLKFLFSIFKIFEVQQYYYLLFYINVL